MAAAADENDNAEGEKELQNGRGLRLYRLRNFRRRADSAAQPDFRLRLVSCRRSLSPCASRILFLRQQWPSDLFTLGRAKPNLSSNFAAGSRAALRCGKRGRGTGPPLGQQYLAAHGMHSG